MGYLTGSLPSPESAFKNKTVLKGDANKQKGTLEVLNLARDDVAVYFCAASPHSDTNIFPPEQKHVTSYQFIRASVTSFIAQYTCIKHRQFVFRERELVLYCNISDLVVSHVESVISRRIH